MALRAGFDPARIGYHGNNKTHAELRRAVAEGVGRIVLDSFVEIERLAQITARARAGPQPVMVRVTAGVEAHTHEYIATAHEDQKFGLSITSRRRLGGGTPRAGRPGPRPARPALPHRQPDLRLLRLRGRRPPGAGPARPDLRRARRRRCPSSTSAAGSASPTRPRTTRATPRSSPRRSPRSSSTSARPSEIEQPRLSIEPGRAIVGPSTCTVYTVGTVKPVELDGGAVRTYVSVDGGMSDNVRTALYDADYSCTIANRAVDRGAGAVPGRRQALRGR